MGTPIGREFDFSFLKEIKSMERNSLVYEAFIVQGGRLFRNKSEDGVVSSGSKSPRGR